MATTKVHFISGMDARMHYGGNEVLIPRDEYLHVCTIHGLQSPHDTWNICQNVDSLWHEDPRWSNVEFDSLTLSHWGERLVDLSGALRSMMAGDIVEHIEDGWARYYLCASFGWVEVELGFDDHFHSEERDERIM